MPINVYTGLMRSGKSYEVVSEVIVPAIRSGRRVVTNVDGISEAAVHEFLKLNHPTDDETHYGKILHVDNAAVFLPDFFPFYDDQKGSHTDTVVQPGDLVCIDEAWRFWGSTDCKIHKNHKSFFLEHGHFTNEKTGVACDLVLMIQDMLTLHRFVKNVVAFNFRTHKKVSLGMGNTYSVTCFEGSKQSKAVRIGEWVRKYKKEIFPLYSSFKGGVEGKTVNVDKRQNIFASKKLIVGGLLFLAFGIWSMYTVFRFFKPLPKSDAVAVVDSKTGVAAVPGAAGAVPVKPPGFSDVWRISGSVVVGENRFVVVSNGAGAVRLESPSSFSNYGLVQVGTIDSEKVSTFSGANARSVPAAPAAAPAVVSPGSVSVPFGSAQK